MNYELMLHELRRDYEELQEDMKFLKADLEEKELLLSKAQERLSKLETPPAFSNVIGCDFCTKDKIMLKRNFISTGSWGWGAETTIKLSEAIEDEIGVFIDRGTLRMAWIHDCNCMDDGMPKIDIKFCPICGAKIIAS